MLYTWAGIHKYIYIYKYELCPIHLHAFKRKGYIYVYASYIIPKRFERKSLIFTSWISVKLELVGFAFIGLCFKIV